MTIQHGYQTQMLRAKAAFSEAQLLGTYMGDVRDQPSFDAAIDQWEQATGKRSPYFGMTYSDQLANDIEASSRTAKDRATERMKALEEQNRERHRRVQEGQQERRLEFDKMKAEQSKRREDRLEKGGGKPVTYPTQGEVDQAYRLIRETMPNKEEFPDIQAMTAASAVASRAKMIRAQNPGIDPDMAIRKAWEEMRKDIATISRPGTKIMGIEVGKGTKEEKFIRGPGSRDEPFDATKQKPESFQEGAWYNTPKGLRQYMGGDRWAKPGGEPPAAPAEPEEPEDEDESED